MISVCLASYNGDKYILKQIRSILNQLGKEDELIISDDGSKDNTLEVIKSFEDSRLKIYQNVRHGVVGNFENAIKHANGDFIFLSDQDDEWMPNKVEKCLKALDSYDCIVTDCFLCDGNGNIVHNSFFELNETKKGKFYNLIIKNGYMGSCMAFRREILSSILPFPEDIPLHDMWIGNVAAFKYRLGWLPDKLIKYRRHGGNASSASGKSKVSFVRKISYRWHIIRHIIK